VREFGCEVEGMNSASRLLDKFTRGTGAMGYLEFVTNVIGLQPDALREKAGSQMPAPHEVLNKFQEGLKATLLGNPSTRDKAFTVFDKDGGGSISIAEFREGIERMGLPVNKKQVDQLFKQFDAGNVGALDMMSFTRDLMGMDGQKAPSSAKTKSSSRGGAPCMPKEFRVPTARPKTQASVDLSRPMPNVDLQSSPLRTSSPTKQRAASVAETKRHLDRSGSPSRAPSTSHSQVLVINHEDETQQLPDLSRVPSRTPDLTHNSFTRTPPLSQRSKSPSILSHSPIPSHRIKNMQAKPVGKYIGNFFVTDAGQGANFTPQQVAQITNSPLRQSPSLSRPKSNMFSNQQSLPHYQLGSTLGRAAPET